ncbi:MAG: hypothetical protein K2P26_09725 [Oscillospiraceae bacterium]|nr:hypothetical protein [Oscillospiraceae bacterium]
MFRSTCPQKPGAARSTRQTPERRAPAAGALETWTRGLDRIRYLPAGEVPELLEDTK